ncbi:MAG TPA: hypothetical protein VK447_01965, partial [Myxococcaceae bacterium]|nr:hypothetical protein [Myxococcaceae bacterium]
MKTRFLSLVAGMTVLAACGPGPSSNSDFPSAQDRADGVAVSQSALKEAGPPAAAPFVLPPLQTTLEDYEL